MKSFQLKLKLLIGSVTIMGVYALLVTTPNLVVFLFSLKLQAVQKLPYPKAPHITYENFLQM